ncbi:ImcF-related family protein [Biostraticola tofi]|uniref:Type VI secretion system protein ImpL n=1 Tax=Biostraticola tofi TaxID=466109 RepID=A0A4R3Z4P3_9GAMM|nr:ImcF-related family protein [Biostraticola tofi]TCW00153.1 type VI secretion system protein ImpL [Biostraticola tofi]
MNKRRLSTWIIILCLLAIGNALIWLKNPFWVLPNETVKMKATLGLVVACLFLIVADGMNTFGLAKLASLDFFRRFGHGGAKPAAVTADNTRCWLSLTEHLRYRYGRRWRSRTRLLLLLGDVATVEQVAPGLTHQQWLESEGTVLLWAGDIFSQGGIDNLSGLRRLRRRPLDAVIWTTGETTTARADAMARRLHIGFRALGWQVPLYLWEVGHSQWNQQDSPSQTVGCLLPVNCTPERVAGALAGLTPGLTRQGMAQVMNNERHDYLLRLAQSWSTGGIDRIRIALAPLIAGPQSVCLAGMMFSLPLAARDGVTPHGWLPDAGWQGIINDAGTLPARRLGVRWHRVAQWGVIGLAVLWGTGSVLSFLNNRSQINENRRLADAAGNRATPLADRLQQQQALQLEIGRLQHNAAASTPWHVRFGLDTTEQQLAALWPRYGRLNQQLMRDAAAGQLQQAIRQLSASTSTDAAAKQHARQLYNHLKAYLMMARAEKVEPAFLAQSLARVWPHREGVPDGVWQATAPALLAFYAGNLPAHADWRIQPDASLINQARSVLLRQSARQDLEIDLYQKLLARVVNSFPEMTLDQLTGATDASLLFTTDSTVPGMFTLEAWQQKIRGTIDEMVNQRGAEADWVLSDNQARQQELTSDDLKARLRERYFSDFASVWLEFLNSIQWQPAGSLSDSIDQLTLMADVRQSPLTALMKSVARQARAGQNDLDISGSVERRTRGLFGGSDINERASTERQPGPLDSTFGPLLALMDPQAGGQGNNALNLQTYLTRMTRIRLKMQQITNAPDPKAMAQALAQTVFQGKTVDLTDTRDYGSLLAASLGQEWSNFGEALFVQPVEQAWHQVLTPTASSLNAQWQHAIVDEWNLAFDGRYPFRQTSSDASLPLLAQYLRSDSGRISRFLSTRLSGVLHKEGNQWVPDAMNTQGMPINPEFIRSINQLSQLADMVFADGDAGMQFELMARPARDVVQTNLMIDGQEIKYFNQMESWQAINWPGNSFKPGVMLTWASTTAGSREYANFQGSWGLIRLLDKAQVTPIDSSRYQLVWRAQDGLPLNYILRTELGKGPLALLELKGFRLPDTIFLE